MVCAKSNFRLRNAGTLYGSCACRKRNRPRPHKRPSFNLKPPVHGMVQSGFPLQRSPLAFSIVRSLNTRRALFCCPCPPALPPPHPIPPHPSSHTRPAHAPPAAAHAASVPHVASGPCCLSVRATVPPVLPPATSRRGATPSRLLSCTHRIARTLPTCPVWRRSSELSCQDKPVRVSDGHVMGGAVLKRDQRLSGGGRRTP